MSPRPATPDAYTSQPATPPHAPVDDAAPPSLPNPLVLPYTPADLDLWEYLDSYDTQHGTSPTASVYVPSSAHTDAPKSILSAAEFGRLLEQCNTLAKTTPSAEPDATTSTLSPSLRPRYNASPSSPTSSDVSTFSIPPSFRPTYNWDAGMTSLATLAAVFKQVTAAGLQKASSSHSVPSAAVYKTSVEALDRVWLNDPYEYR